MLILTLMILVSIAFFTLMERKMISYIQLRKGPNKVAIIGIIQPMADAIKLMSKELNMNLKSNFNMYFLSPVLNIICSLMMWMTMPFIFNFGFMKMSMIFIMACASMNTISIMMMSWASNSNYAYIGMMRTIAQLISYEINFMMIIITMMNLTEQMNMNMMEKMQKYIPLILITPTVYLMWMLTALAETNRTPFDFSEGESELISGFNIEFSGKSFMLLFLAEYSSILMMSMITTMMFNSSNKNPATFMMMYTLTCSAFIWTRATLPRFRYDKLMSLNWTQLLPLTTMNLMISFIMKIYCAKKINKTSDSKSQNNEFKPLKSDLEKLI